MAEKEVKISEQHVWVGIGDQHVYLGLTNYIQGALGTVISFELPDVGDNIVEGEIFAEIESVSTVHEFLSPSWPSIRSLTITLRLLTRSPVAKDG
jgi:glycine cleavage system H protein